MSTFSAVKQMAETLPRLRSWIIGSGKSLRAICAETEKLEPPERMAHGNLSNVLTGKPNHNLYLQQAIVLCNVIGVPPAALLIGISDPRIAKDAVQLSKAYAKLPEARRAHLLTTIVAEASGK